MANDLPFIVELRDVDGRMMIGAAADNAIVGRAAFDAWVNLRPNVEIVFRHKARVIARSGCSPAKSR